jgi:hypothetical protein
VGFAAIPVSLLLSVLVVTPRERIIGICRDLAAMVDRGDVRAIGRHLSDEFEVDGIDRDEFLYHVERILTQCHIDDARLRRFDVTFPSDVEGLAGFTAACTVRSSDVFYDRMVSRWRLTFRRHGQAWRVTGIETVPTAMSPIRDVREFLR